MKVEDTMNFRCAFSQTKTQMFVCLHKVNYNNYFLYITHLFSFPIKNLSSYLYTYIYINLYKSNISPNIYKSNPVSVYTCICIYIKDFLLSKSTSIQCELFTYCFVYFSVVHQETKTVKKLNL